ncbi:hypothetical protein BZA70DRAFT_264507 [Myxozyma melibiosi]|uniref:Uncharacterized protein n=1 Tax=Myxozyma melibiosi TaxID=54550 RepID=A0ABR1FB85_9ASCO
MIDLADLILSAQELVHDVGRSVQFLLHGLVLFAIVYVIFYSTASLRAGFDHEPAGRYRREVETKKESATRKSAIKSGASSVKPETRKEAATRRAEFRDNTATQPAAIPEDSLSELTLLVKKSFDLLGYQLREQAGEISGRSSDGFRQVNENIHRRLQGTNAVQSDWHLRQQIKDSSNRIMDEISISQEDLVEVSMSRFASMKIHMDQLTEKVSTEIKESRTAVADIVNSLNAQMSNYPTEAAAVLFGAINDLIKWTEENAKKRAEDTNRIVTSYGIALVDFIQEVSAWLAKVIESAQDVIVKRLLWLDEQAKRRDEKSSEQLEQLKQLIEERDRRLDRIEELLVTVINTSRGQDGTPLVARKISAGTPTSNSPETTDAAGKSPSKARVASRTPSGSSGGASTPVSGQKAPADAAIVSRSPVSTDKASTVGDRAPSPENAKSILKEVLAGAIQRKDKAAKPSVVDTNAPDSQARASSSSKAKQLIDLTMPAMPPGLIPAVPIPKSQPRKSSGTVESPDDATKDKAQSSKHVQYKLDSEPELLQVPMNPFDKAGKKPAAPTQRSRRWKLEKEQALQARLEEAKRSS